MVKKPMISSNIALYLLRNSRNLHEVDMLSWSRVGQYSDVLELATKIVNQD